jgi:glycosyltransferase involved in cell wall biosynthesis
MTRKVRVLLVTRRFWPHSGCDAAAASVELATGLARLALSVEVLTPRYAANWPHVFRFRDMTVHRPVAAPRSEWSISRYLRHTSHWLAEHREQYDVVYVDGGREEVTAVHDVTRNTTTTRVVRLNGSGRNADVLWWGSSRSSGRALAATKLFDGIIVRNASDHRAALANGISPSRVHRVDHGFSAGRARSSTDRSIARRVLGEVNGDFMTQMQTPVLLCIGPMMRHNGMDLLAEVMPMLVAKYPDARVWFVGDGPHREALYSKLRADGVRVSIAMPGHFTETVELMSAADLYLQLDDDDGLSCFLPNAIASELPVVAVKTSAVTQLLDAHDGQPIPVRWFEPENSESLLQAILLGLDRPSTVQSDASSLRRRLVRSRPQHACFENHAALFQQIVQDRLDHQSRSNFEAAS